MNLFEKFRHKLVKSKERKRVEEKKEKVIKERAIKPAEALKTADKEKEAAPTAAKIEVQKEDTGKAYRTLVRPVVTEKSAFLGSLRKYVFVVARGANKTDIKKAVQDVYGVAVSDVNVINVRGKKVRHGRIEGRRKDWQKAVITLEPGQKIEVYEGV